VPPDEAGKLISIWGLVAEPPTVSVPAPAEAVLLTVPTETDCTSLGKLILMLGFAAVPPMLAVPAPAVAALAIVPVVIAWTTPFVPLVPFEPVGP
jgi:hypothetical protein